MNWVHDANCPVSGVTWVMRMTSSQKSNHHFWNLETRETPLHKPTPWSRDEVQQSPKLPPIDSVSHTLVVSPFGFWLDVNYRIQLTVVTLQFTFPLHKQQLLTLAVLNYRTTFILLNRPPVLWSKTCKLSLTLLQERGGAASSRCSAGQAGRAAVEDLLIKGLLYFSEAGTGEVCLWVVTGVTFHYVM